MSDPDLSSGADGALWTRRFLVLLGAVLVVRTGFVILSPLDLIGDEAYYWDWSRRLDLGYFSKPPMIAWLNALSTRLLGTSETALRLPAAILSTAGTGFLFVFARGLFGARVGFFAGAASAATPGGSALGALMTIDAPFLFFFSASLAAARRAIDGKRLGAWLLLGLTMGLGNLSKQMMLTLAPILVLFLLTSRRDRRTLRSPGPWLAIAVSLLFLLPPLRWNAEHDWVTFSHTGSHFRSSAAGILHHLGTFFEFVGAQLGVVSPITAAIVAVLSARLLPTVFVADRRVRLLLLLGAVPLALIALLSFTMKVEANWPAAFVPPGIVLAAAWGCGEVSAGPRLDRLRRWFFRGVGVGAVLAALVYVLPLTVSAAGLSGTKYDPFARMAGWSRLALAVDRVRSGLPRPHETFLLARRRDLLSELAFYSPGRPRTWGFSPGIADVSSQYDVWPGPTDRIGQDALILVRPGREVPEHVAACFLEVVPRGELAPGAGLSPRHRYQLYLGRRLQRWYR